METTSQETLSVALEMNSSQAESYQRGSGDQLHLGSVLIEKLKLERGNTVLDLGCGTGRLSKSLSDKVGPEGKVVAVDPDGERLKIAREKYSAPNIDYIQADDQTFPSGQYDVIFCNIVIHWISDKTALFRRVYDNLQQGGTFAFTTHDGHLPGPEIGKKLFDILVRPGYLHWLTQEKMKSCSASEYETLATNAGFTDIAMEVLPHYPKWKNLDEYIDAMYGWFQGEFDPTKFDKDILTELKCEHGSGPVIQSQPTNVLCVLLKK